jgi:UDP-N-acetylglucosamine 1-carboxyvinyltransferase
MQKMIVKGGTVLNGKVSASGAKNSALPLLFSTLLAEGEHIFHNVPDLMDIQSTAALLEYLGCTGTI